MSERLLHFNGIDGSTGDYALPPRSLGDFSALVARGTPGLPVAPRRLKFGLDPLDLADAGWGVIWAEEPSPSVREALQPLLDHRREQACRRNETYFKEFNYLPGETTLEFWRRHGLGPNVVDPAKMPYYLLIVGEPTQIPFELQAELGVPHAVGRISFDSPQGYADYGRQLIEAESRTPSSAPTLAFFGVENPDDEPTRLSVEHLVRPLELDVATRHPDWRVRTVLRGAADKAWLSQLLGGGVPPTLLFTASHALRFHPDNPRQPTHQGALLCADWPGRRGWKGRGPIPDDFLFSGEDLASSTRLQGLVAFHFACYTAGTPHRDPYADTTAKLAAHEPFVSHLPKRLLQSGALAVIGHVDVTLEQSFLWLDSGSQAEIFLSTLEALMAGVPVGHAMDPFGERFGLLGAIVAEASRSRQGNGFEAEDLRRFQLWAAYQDARNYVILGDPAVSLKVGC